MRDNLIFFVFKYFLKRFHLFFSAGVFNKSNKNIILKKAQKKKVEKIITKSTLSSCKYIQFYQLTKIQLKNHTAKETVRKLTLVYI